MLLKSLTKITLHNITLYNVTGEINFFFVLHSMKLHGVTEEFKRRLFS